MPPNLVSFDPQAATCSPWGHHDRRRLLAVIDGQLNGRQNRRIRFIPASTRLVIDYPKRVKEAFQLTYLS